jgi:hypothetical protein
MDAIAKLLNELKAEYEQPQAKSVNPPQPVSKPISKPKFVSTSSSDAIDQLIIDVKADFIQQDLAQELQTKQQAESRGERFPSPELSKTLEQEHIQQAQLQAQQLEVLQKQAEDWLGKLDPFSPEGLWFERFAERYGSKLEAAIDYLQQN